MEKKDLIVRFSGDTSKVEEAFQEIIGKAAELGLIGSDLSIKKVPDKVEKNRLRNKSASDIMIKVSTSEEKAEAFMEELISIASESLGLDSPSTGIKLLSETSDDEEN